MTKCKNGKCEIKKPKVKDKQVIVNGQKFIIKERLKLKK